MKKNLFVLFLIIGAFLIGFSSKISASVKIKKISNSSNGIKLTWKCNNKNVRFKIYRSENGSKFYYYAKTISKKYIDKYVETGNVYSYSIKAYRIKNHKTKAVGKVKYSGKITALPKGPINLTITKEEKSYSLSWEKDFNSSYFIIYKKINNGEYVAYDKVDGSQNTYEDLDVDFKNKYDYKVQSVVYVDGIDYYSKLSGESSFTGKYGIDVSYHNGVINWKKVKKAGIKFAMIRLGYGTKKGGFTDTKLDYNYKQARKNGIKVGFYFYSYATSKKLAKKEAKYTLKLLKKYSKFEFPVSYDFEEPSRCKSKYKKSNTAIIRTYCDYLEKRGYDTSVYSYVAFFKKAIDVKKISKYGIWLARWTGSSKKFNSLGIPNVEMWQYSSNGRKKGIKGRVDLNVVVK